METGLYTAIRSITILAVVLIPAPVGKCWSFLPPHPGIDYPSALLHKVRHRWAGPPALRPVDSKPGRPGLPEISAGTGLRPRLTGRTCADLFSFLSAASSRIGRLVWTRRR